jgi:hypothetical protein
MGTKMNFLTTHKMLSLVELRILKLAPEQNTRDSNKRTCKPSKAPPLSQAEEAPAMESSPTRLPEVELKVN